MLRGGINLIEKGEIHWIFTLQFIIGLVTVILNPLGKQKLNRFTHPLSHQSKKQKKNPNYLQMK